MYCPGATGNSRLEVTSWVTAADVTVTFASLFDASPRICTFSSPVCGVAAPSPPPQLEPASTKADRMIATESRRMEFTLADPLARDLNAPRHHTCPWRCADRYSKTRSIPPRFAAATYSGSQLGPSTCLAISTTM